MYTHCVTDKTTISINSSCKFMVFNFSSTQIFHRRIVTFAERHTGRHLPRSVNLCVLWRGDGVIAPRALIQFCIRHIIHVSLQQNPFLNHPITYSLFLPVPRRPYATLSSREQSYVTHRHQNRRAP